MDSLNTGRSEFKEMSTNMRSKSSDINFSETNQRGFLLRSESNNYKSKILDMKNTIASKNVEIYGIKQEYDNMKLVIQHLRSQLSKAKKYLKNQDYTKFKNLEAEEDDFKGYEYLKRLNKYSMVDFNRRK